MVSCFYSNNHRYAEARDDLHTNSERKRERRKAASSKIIVHICMHDACNLKEIIISYQLFKNTSNWKKIYNSKSEAIAKF